MEYQVDSELKFKLKFRVTEARRRKDKTVDDLVVRAVTVEAMYVVG